MHFNINLEFYILQTSNLPADYAVIVFDPNLGYKSQFTNKFKYKTS